MKLNPGLEQRHDPRLYLQLGELIASTGDACFATHMLRLVDTLVPIHRLDLSEWTLDARRGSISRIKVLGGAGLGPECPAPDQLSHPLLQNIMQMKDPLLIQLKAPVGRHTRHSAHQCNLVSCNGDRRLVICFHRQTRQRAFSLAELSLLKSLSDTLLPLLERHGLLVQPGADTLPAEPHPSALRQAFGGRLAQEAIHLSAREQEVCLGLLTGGTVPQMAQRLSVKNSSVETYLKRATAKLGVSGRHGLARWMAGA
ncbi:LuxR C-terminal-related transcriptional regulator [Pseudomonas entomophila]|uniref:helix-turn-helix transcriptional regulator n=1 Tax=Pseudomonas entomophila TaxID=312306 RepID=UPI0023D7E31E|nr:LuxR family transcriptional regulator [Pseudomonas entomophila]MDF0732881.1 LuxR C-terminal-related transcriptional regulator [Pseudomonas entomophila]